MGISFNEVPDGARAPKLFIEIDTSKSQQGPSIQNYSALLVGQRLSAGTKPANQFDLITSADQAREFYGPGSMLAAMARAWFGANKSTSLRAYALDDDGASVAATSTLTLTGPATAAGTLSVMVAGRRYRIAVASGDSETDVAAALVAEITLDDDRQVDAGNIAGVVTFTHRNKGELGNELDTRLNPFQGEELPAGIGGTIVSFATLGTGSANPDLSAAFIADLGDTQFHIMSVPYTDASNFTTLDTELQDRFGAERQIEGQNFMAKNDSFSALVTFGDSKNSPHMTVVGVAGPTPVWEWAANVAGVVAFNGQIDPGRPFQTLELDSVIAPDDAEQFSYNERDLLLKDGIATVRVAAGAQVVIDRMITTFQVNNSGAPDTSLLDVNTLLTLSFLRFDFRTRFQLKFPRHKLANDGTNFGPGQVVLTPKIAKAEAIAIFRSWEFDRGLVENIDQFKRDLIVERNASDPNRLDILLPPDLINQFRIGGVQIGFLL